MSLQVHTVTVFITLRLCAYKDKPRPVHYGSVELLCSGILADHCMTVSKLWLDPLCLMFELDVYRLTNPTTSLNRDKVG